jgi:hypothetical protein
MPTSRCAPLDIIRRERNIDAPLHAQRTLDRASSTTNLSPNPQPDPQPHAYCLIPIPQSQPILPCLLRRLLLQGDTLGARLLAHHHQHGPHFLRSLEWLLFTSLDHDFGVSSGSEDYSTDASDRGATAESSGHALLSAVFDLVCRFPQWRDVVVNVSRKTDATMWPLLFSVVGEPSRLLEDLLRAGQVCLPLQPPPSPGRAALTSDVCNSLAECNPTHTAVCVGLHLLASPAGGPCLPLLAVTLHMSTRVVSQRRQVCVCCDKCVWCPQVHTASCLLVVVDSVEGAHVAHDLALSLVKAALQDFLCDLCAELLRFLYPACDLDMMDTIAEPHGVAPGNCCAFSHSQHYGALFCAPMSRPFHPTRIYSLGVCVADSCHP